MVKALTIKITMDFNKILAIMAGFTTILQI